jgi:cytochrome c nitrite reductase small subunit
MGNDDSKKKGFLGSLAPPPGWRLPVAILSGILCGFALTAFFISNASSYISDDPEACINCHIMTPQYSTWFHSSHRENATCNDCHVPHENAVRKYFFKASDGMRHATMFTLRQEPQVIKIKEAGVEVVQNNCIRCHSNTNHSVSIYEVTGKNTKLGKGMLCWDCHREVPHGRVHSEASTMNSIIPGGKTKIPDWIKSKEK